jgi:hypothetical protein
MWDNTLALQEGWDVFGTDEVDEEGNGYIRLAIQKLDDPSSVPELGYNDPKFDTDDQAYAFVLEKAKTSAYHQQALDLHFTIVKPNKYQRPQEN